MFFLAFALAVQATASSAGGAAMHVIDKGGQSGIDEPRQVVIRTSEEWTKLWRVHGMDRARPKVDFSKEMVVGVFMGSRPTAGFDVEIVGVDEDRSAGRSGPRTIVRYREKAPSRDMMTAQILTSPYVLVAVPKSAGEVKFEKVQ